MRPTSPHFVHRPNVPDGGWGWAVVFGSFMISLVSDGFAYTTGIFYEQFLGIYKESEAMTSLFDSIMTGMIYLMGPVAGGLATAYGCRKVAILGSILTIIGMLSSIVLDSIYLHCLTLGFITGTGLGLIYLPQIVIVSFWFDKHLSLAMGISVCGTGFGIAIFAVVTEELIDAFKWKGAMLILSGLMSTSLFYASLFRKFDSIEENSSLKEALKETFNFRILKNCLFMYFAFTHFLSGTVYYVPIIFLKDHLKKTGYGSDKDTVRLMVFFGLSNAFGRALFGYIADRESLNRSILYAMSTITYGAAIGMIAAFGHNNIMLSFSVILFGISEGAYVCLYSVVIVDLFGVEKLSNVFGIINLILGAASFIGPPLIGKTVDPKTGYTTGFWISSILTIMSGFLLLFLPLIQRDFKSDVD